ncbi:cell division control protein 4 [Coniophora puteana RWD-64-598 SS2]|uniref:Cell division control protein 4 n=1 Tax=Coniophora puteana (strain RWD-64-598) TaxID=741705 RepID=A0A5M3N177_CONPW|nr:cell division control protein 4 [Coniophora puteana RWD-64-598 SS2]EIW84774.1 cell division control protein 4 [Coniophora puteana RWD-64-598 SS2]
MSWLSNTDPAHRSFPAHGSSVVTSLLLSRGRIISASDDHSIHVYSLLSGELLHSLEGHESGVWANAAKGDTLVSGSSDRTVRVWDLATGKCTHVFGGHTSTVRCVAIVTPEWVDVEDENGAVTKEKWPKRSVIVSGSRDHSMHVWALPQPNDEEYKSIVPEYEDEEDDVTGNPYHLLHLTGHENAVRALAAQGRVVVSGSYDNTVRVWDIVTGECKWMLTGHKKKVYSVALDLARRQAYSGSMDDTVRIWDIQNGQCKHTLTGHTSLVGLLGLSSSHLVSASADANICIWDPDTGELRHKLTGLLSAVTCFQHDDSKVLSGSDGVLRMWSVRDGTAVRDLLTGQMGVWQVAFNGRWCVAASSRNDQTMLHIWDFGVDGDEMHGEETEDGNDDAK